MVQLPCLKNPPSLGNSWGQAVKQRISDEKSIVSKDCLNNFNNVLHEYLVLDHAEMVPRADLHLQPHYYLPVHCILKKVIVPYQTTSCFWCHSKNLVWTHSEWHTYCRTKDQPQPPKCAHSLQKAQDWVVSRHLQDFSGGSLSPKWARLQPIHPTIQGWLLGWLPNEAIDIRHKVVPVSGHLGIAYTC